MKRERIKKTPTKKTAVRAQHTRRTQKSAVPQQSRWAQRIAHIIIGVVCVSSCGAAVYMYGARTALYTFDMPRLAAVLHSQDTDVLMELGNRFLSPESYSLIDARSAYARVLAIDPAYPGANYQIGRTYFLVGDHALALMYLEEEERLRPTFGKVHYMKGLVYGYMKKFDEAGREFRAFIAYDSFNWAGYNDLAWIYFSQGYYEDAEATAREGLAQAAGNPWLNNAIGVALLAQGRHTEAAPYFEEARSGFARMTPGEWGGAYPGNSPDEHAAGLAASLGAVERNLIRAQTPIEPSGKPDTQSAE
jgi:tetratricopeptide (TPR) repeat protein